MTALSTCSHGREGLCLDEVTPEQRAAFEDAHRFAYAWAMSAHVERDDAEAFAGWYAAREYASPAEAWGWASKAFEDYERELGRRPAEAEWKPAPRYRRGRAA